MAPPNEGMELTGPTRNALSGVVMGLRNLLIGSFAALLAIVVAGLAQGALDFLLPDVSQVMLGNTDVSTYFVLCALGLLFFAAGLFVPRWLRGSIPLLWLLLPLSGVYLLARLVFPSSYGCVPGAVSGCWMVQLPFVVAVFALVGGYSVRRVSARSQRAARQATATDRER